MQGTPTYAFETRDGQQVRVFSADMTDEARLRDLIDRATPENRVTASQSQPSTASADVAAVLLDGYTWIALIEGDPDDADPVAVARYSQVCEGEVAVSVVMRDDMQGRGIGSRMLYFLLDQARRRRTQGDHVFRKHERSCLAGDAILTLSYDLAAARQQDRHGGLLASARFAWNHDELMEQR